MLFSHAMVAQDLPDLGRGHGDVDVADSEMPEGIHNGIHNGGRRAHRGRLPYPFSPQRMMG